MRARVGILGCGAIVRSYLKNLTTDFGDVLTVVACADLSTELAESVATEFGIERVVTTNELVADPGIEVIVNLTPAPVHFQTSWNILEAGKHLFTEKPLCLSLVEAKELLAIAEEKGVQVGGAADTFLGAGFQVAKSLIDKGKIGKLVAGTALVTLSAYSSKRYHLTYQGALLDLGPYYLTALVQLFGSVRSVVGLAPLNDADRIDSSSGEAFRLERGATAGACLIFASGAVATVLASCDVSGYFPRVEAYGTEGRLTLADANFYSGTLRLENGDGVESIVPTETDGFCKEGRGLGLADMCSALQEGRKPSASGDLLYHVLEVMLAVYQTSDTGRKIDIESEIQTEASWRR